MAKNISEIAMKISVNATAVSTLCELIETMVRNRAVLPGECIIALDSFAANAKGLDSLFVTEVSEPQAK